MNIDQLHADCLLRSLSDAQFRKSMSVLNERFTTRRDALAGYGDEAELVSAYTAFYLPTNMKKLAFVLSQMGGLSLVGDAPLEVVDFGCGPGTYGFAMYEYLRDGLGNDGDVGKVHFRFIDAAPLMLQQAKRIQEVMYPDMSADFHRGLPGAMPDVQRWAVFGNVINEMGTDGFDMIFRALNPQVLICIEPGTRASFGAMKAVRRIMVNAGYRVRYPCSASTACPLEAEGENWCHQVQKVTLEPAVARLGQLAALDRTVMPFVGHVYIKPTGDGREDISVDSVTVHRGVLFRLKTHSKHAFFWEVCMQTDEGLQLRKVELAKRGMSKPEQKKMARFSAGQRIGFCVEKKLGNGSFRIRNVTGIPG